MRKKIDTMKEEIGKIFLGNTPDWLYLLFSVPYWHLHPNRKNVKVTPASGYWLVYRGKDSFAVPSPKQAQRDFEPEHAYQNKIKVERGDVVLDLGACIGEFTVSAAEKASKVIAIEPHPKNVVSLKANTKKFENVKIYQKGVWRKKGTIKLNLSQGIGEHSVVYSSNESIEIPVDKLDSIVSELSLPKIDFLKMDVEGAELEVLRGAEEALNVVNKISIAGYHARNGEKTAFRASERLEEKGFKTWITSEFIIHGKNQNF